MIVMKVSLFLGSELGAAELGSLFKTTAFPKYLLNTVNKQTKFGNLA